MSPAPFTTLVGTGNDFVLVDTIRHRVAPPRGGWPALAQALCDERRSGADGPLVLGRSRRADVRMRIFNPDGSEASMCGNGLRCLAWYAHQHRMASQQMTVETGAGVRDAQILRSGRVRVNMGAPRFLKCVSFSRLGGQRDVEADLIDSGVPHLVCWVRDVDRIDIETLGRRLRFDRQFRPAGTNVDFVEDLKTAQRRSRAVYDRGLGEVVERWRLPMRTYERGVEAETQACGTGAVAAAAALAHRRMPPAPVLGRESDLKRCVVDVHVPGGALRVYVAGKSLFDKDRVIFKDAFLEGEARVVSSGTFPGNGRGVR